MSTSPATQPEPFENTFIPALDEGEGFIAVAAATEADVGRQEQLADAPKMDGARGLSQPASKFSK